MDADFSWAGELATPPPSPPSPWQRQSSNGSDWSVSLVPFEMTAAFEEILYSDNDLSDDDTQYEDEAGEEKGAVKHCQESGKEMKNQKERERMALKRMLLEELGSCIQRCDMIPDSEKKPRFTEARTVYLTRMMIRSLEEQVTLRGGGTKTKKVARPPQKTPSKVPKTKKPSNPFINFSSHFRECFVQALREKWAGVALKSYPHTPIKNPSQKLVQKVAAEVWKKVDKERWPSHCIILQLARAAVEKIF